MNQEDINKVVEEIASYIESWRENVIMELPVEEIDLFRSCWQGTAHSIRKKFIK